MNIKIFFYILIIVSSLYHTALSQGSNRFPNLPDSINNAINSYDIDSNVLFDAILLDSTVTDIERTILSIGELSKSSGILHFNNMLSSAINYQITYGVSSENAVERGSILFTKVPVSLWTSPLVIFSESEDETVGGESIGTDISSYGGVIGFDILLPYIVNSRVGIFGGGGIATSKSTGYYRETFNDLTYGTGGIYLNWSYLNMRFVYSTTYIVMINNVRQTVKLDDVNSSFITHNIESFLSFAYDFNLNNIIISPFVGLNYSFYFKPDVNFTGSGIPLMSLKSGIKNTLFMPIGLTLSHTFPLSRRSSITPSIRVNANIMLFDTGIDSTWELSGAENIDLTFNLKDPLGLLDVNFNLSWSLSFFTLYGDYTLRALGGQFSHYASIGTRWFF